MSANGLFINYEFCTGCHSCEVACKKEHKLPKGQFGMHVLQDGPRQMLDGKWEFTYIPYPSHQCDLCAERTAKGRLPTCVHHCQAGVMEYGPLEELVKYAEKYPKSMIYSL